MAFLEITCSAKNGTFRVQFHSLHLNSVLLYDWLRLVHPNLFVEIEIHRTLSDFSGENGNSSSLDDSNSSFSSTSSYLRSKNRQNRVISKRKEWYSVILYGFSKKTCRTDEIFQKTFRTTYIKNLFVKVYEDETGARYELPPSLCLSSVPTDEEFFADRVAYQIYFHERQQNRSHLKSDFERNFKHLTGEGQVTLQNITELGRQYGVEGGHWLTLYREAPEGHNSSEFIFESLQDWHCLLKSFLFGPLSSNEPRSPLCTSIGSKLIRGCGIFLQIFTERVGQLSSLDEVKKLFTFEKLIRESGVYATLLFKMDVYSVCEIYKGNSYHLRPTLLKSKTHFDRNDFLEVSEIYPHYTLNYKPELEDIFQGESWYNSYSLDRNKKKM